MKQIKPAAAAGDSGSVSVAAAEGSDPEDVAGDLGLISVLAAASGLGATAAR